MSCGVYQWCGSFAKGAASTENFERIAHLRDRVTLHQADLNDLASLVTVVQEVRPAEVYNLAAQSFVPTSWKQPLLTTDVTASGVTRVLEAIRLVDPKGVRFYQASSSEMFGKVQQTPQTETTSFYPRSPRSEERRVGKACRSRG